MVRPAYVGQEPMEMAMQQNHDKNDTELVTIDADQAQQALDVMNDILDEESDTFDSDSDIVDALTALANEDEDAVQLTPEQAQRVAEVLREQGTSDDLLVAFQSVEKQHELQEPLELGSDHDGGIGDINRDKSSPAPGTQDSNLAGDGED